MIHLVNPALQGLEREFSRPIMRFLFRVLLAELLIVFGYLAYFAVTA